MMKQARLLIPALLFLSLNSVVSVLGDSCPAKEDIYPCSCEEGSEFLEVKCGEGSAGELQKAFNSLRGKTVKIAFKCFSDPCQLKASIFWGLKIKALDMSYVELQGDLDAGSREAMSHLTSLFIQSSPRLARELPNWDLGFLKNLRNLRVWSNQMTEISNKMFRSGPKSLVVLFMVENQFQTIGDEAFASLSNLTLLNVARSQVKYIQRSMFPKEAPRLAVLDFSDNKLTSLPEDIFDDMPSLRTVKLPGNSIGQLPAAPWSKVWGKLKSLDLTNNPLVCDSHMKWMFTKSKPTSLLGKCRYPENLNGKDLSSFVDENS